jgi:hypothetical protein
MCNQNIISNKFDLNLSTTLSSYILLGVFINTESEVGKNEHIFN